MDRLFFVVVDDSNNSSAKCYGGDASSPTPLLSMVALSLAVALSLLATFL